MKSLKFTWFIFFGYNFGSCSTIWYFCFSSNVKYFNIYLKCNFYKILGYILCEVTIQLIQIFEKKMLQCVYFEISYCILLNTFSWQVCAYKIIVIRKFLTSFVLTKPYAVHSSNLLAWKWKCAAVLILSFVLFLFIVFGCLLGELCISCRGDAS